MSGDNEEVRTGEVRVFFEEPTRRYGFIIDGEKDVYFHIQKGGEYVCNGGNEPVFRHAGDGQNLRCPKQGDQILYVLEEVAGKKRAVKWAFPESFLQAEKDIANRPVYRLYRRTGFIKVGRLFREGQARYETLWEGIDINDLRKKFPRSSFHNCIHNEEQSALTIQYKEGERWIDCNDPR